MVQRHLLVSRRIKMTQFDTRIYEVYSSRVVMGTSPSFAQNDPHSPALPSTHSCPLPRHGVTHNTHSGDTGWDNLSFGIVCLLPCKKLTGLLRIKSQSLPHWSHALVNRATNTKESSKQSKINFCFSCLLGETGAF